MLPAISILEGLLPVVITWVKRVSEIKALMSEPAYTVFFQGQDPTVPQFSLPAESGITIP